jgi:predicted metal-dependent HD superfamily phosphohydrolase
MESSVACNTCFDPSTQPSLKSVLRETWLGVTEGLGVTLESAEFWMERLWSMHTEQGRHYHTAVHLEEMIHYFTLLKEDGFLKSMTRDDECTIFLAIFFHDAIYNPKSPSNEEDSALLFQEFAEQVKLTESHESIISNVHSYILATKQHSVSSDNSECMALFLDLDMAVLGKQDAAYQAYAALIRKEYSFVEGSEYCCKRAEILTRFLTHERIFGTELLRQVFEEQARRNIGQEIADLNKIAIYGESLL